MPTLKSSASSTQQKIYRHRGLWRLGVALTMAALLCLMSLSHASAQNLAEYFQLSYDPVSFDKKEISGSEVFRATITGRANCTQDLPMTVNEASITSKVIAKHTASGTTVTLNSSYTVSIKPFPSKQGETAEISQTVPLKFPAQAASGDYNIIGKITEAKVKVSFAWIPVTDYLPQEQSMGVVKYTASEPPLIPENPPPPEPKPGSPPIKSITSGPNIPAPQEENVLPPPEIEQIIPWWVWLVVVIAAASIIMNIVPLVKRRPK